ncbi:MAG: DoxX-like family protein [Oleispira sp.]|nr:DoxX-like family protein [Oleispira sp.]MBL4882723.1 DoxX-like family protein [Oleispira sp.]
MNLSLEQISKITIALLWIVAGFTSVWGAPEIGYQILAQANIIDRYADVCIWLGSGVDIVLGCWILTGFKSSWCGWMQVITIIVYSMILTVIAPEYWLHPFGLLTKNLPILVLIYIVFINKQLVVKN